MGQIELAAEKPESSRVSVEIEMNSVETNEKKLTAHLQSADFFDVARFPKATFVSTEIKPGGEGGATHTVTGNLDMHGVKKAITFPATITITGDNVAMQSEFAINRKDFGIVYPGPANNLIRDEVVLKQSPPTLPIQDSSTETVSASHQTLKPRSMAKTIAWARVHTPSLSKRLET